MITRKKLRQLEEEIDTDRTLTDEEKKAKKAILREKFEKNQTPNVIIK